MKRFSAAGNLLAGALCAALAGACTTSTQQQTQQAQQSHPAYRADIRRTADGIPHIRANDWGSLGYGTGYAQAQDNLCTLGDAFVTYRGERSEQFGAEARPPAAASFGQPHNLDADFFFRFVAGDAAVARFRDAQTPRTRALVEGYAAGYDRYLDDLRAGRFAGAHAACANAAWLRPIDADDVYRRLIAAALAGGEAHFVEAIVHAKPPSAEAAPAASAPQAARASATTASIEIAPTRFDIDQRAGIGSNALAFGAAKTREGASLLFGNPHWFWQGPDRFYEAQLTIPGQLDVAGASFLGVPVVMIGFNDNIAWTHTVSQARRFGIFQLALVPGAPTHYFYDGRDEAMQAVPVTVPVRGSDGAITQVTRTLYRSRFGPLINLSTMSPALAWNAQHAFALRDVNADNTRVFENFLAWGSASSLDDFIAIQKRYAAMPWVNTFAIGRNDPRVWFADIGAMPGVSDALAQACTPPLGRAFDAKAPGVPFLDGSKSACAWQSAPHAPQAQTLGVAQMPSLTRDDYVGNFNGSYWLTNPAAPLMGFARVTGLTGTPQTLRTRLGHALAAQLQAAPGGVTRAALEQGVLASRSMSEELLRRPVLDALCKRDRATQASAVNPADDADVAQACNVLAKWDGTARSDARGANLWDEFWTRASKVPADKLYRVPFDPAAPLTTPNGLNTADADIVAALRHALAESVRALRGFGFAADSPRGQLLYTQRGAARVPLYGGCNDAGYFTVVCAQHPLNAGGYAMDGSGHGDSYVQVVSFGPQGVHADTMLAHSLSDDPASPHFSDATREFARGAWQRFRFTESEIEADPALSSTLLEAAPSR
ncbi:penicillin acylase family protein [Paraburkholderia tropica]|uniref:Acyl-homoserine-lactone acylase n=1 Tax=Paraburkholderia tropica TaxID=92647 RepID=A0ABX5MJ37_9BURK|nr:penicillin acylase family protein [Paraburkholderia tropica]MDE1139845.1 penicillin acylase family protein [Paraburkholderia tropica]PXX08977.1 acyl-homoserine-lactone acylase [Paraburkholderia tropica]PZW74252.1 acyl-homoserine-lactone acylase [Paraburkholderia tropica]